jgi:outer membrane immunogenic protein
MRYVTRLSIAAAAAMAVPFAAQAADLRPPVSKSPVYAPTWTGYYIGGSAGVGSSKTETDPTGAALSCTDASTPPLGLCPLVTNAQVAAVPPALRTHPIGGLLGAQIGYNYQAGAWVPGVETDLSWTNIDGTDTQTGTALLTAGGFTNPGFATATAEQRLKYFGTLRGRLGFLATDPLLVFVTGGLAYGLITANTSLSEVTALPGIGAVNATGLGGYASTWRAGWTLGGGLEYMFATNWSLKAEYLYFNLGSMSYPVGPLNANAFSSLGFGGIATSVAVTATTTNFTGNIVRFGVNYKFSN